MTQKLIIRETGLHEINGYKIHLQKNDLVEIKPNGIYVNGSLYISYNTELFHEYD